MGSKWLLLTEVVKMVAVDRSGVKLLRHGRVALIGSLGRSK